jgi:uncharacterized protein YuzB (UPF0349 family)
MLDQFSRLHVSANVKKRSIDFLGVGCQTGCLWCQHRRYALVCGSRLTGRFTELLHRSIGFTQLFPYVYFHIDQPQKIRLTSEALHEPPLFTPLVATTPNQSGIEDAIQFSIS